MPKLPNLIAAVLLIPYLLSDSAVAGFLTTVPIHTNHFPKESFRRQAVVQALVGGQFLESAATPARLKVIGLAVLSRSAPMTNPGSRVLPVDDFIAWMTSRGTPVFFGRPLTVERIHPLRYLALRDELQSIRGDEWPSLPGLLAVRGWKILRLASRIRSELKEMIFFLTTAVSDRNASKILGVFVARDPESGRLLGVHMLFKPDFVEDLGAEMVSDGIAVRLAECGGRLGSALCVAAFRWLIEEKYFDYAPFIQKTNVASQRMLKTAAAYLGLNVIPVPSPFSIFLLSGYWYPIDLSAAKPLRYAA